MTVTLVEPAGSEAIRVARVVLDPSQPYLNDHRPGGEPLLGTVMGIEVVSRCALLLAPEMTVQAIECLENHAPFVLTTGVAARIEVTLLPEHAGQGLVVRCAIASAGLGHARNLHMQATLRLAPRADLPVAVFEPPREPPRGPMPVTSREVYSLFFHGPALRVVGAACRQSEHFYTHSAGDLPRCFASSDHVVAAPRLIEFALQSAGLFEIAVNRRMMIPHAIRRIERFSEDDIDGGHSFWAVVSPCPQGVTPMDLDIEVYDAKGRRHLQVEAYQTLPLPFAVDTVGVATLARLFS